LKYHERINRILRFYITLANAHGLQIKFMTFDGKLRGYSFDSILFDDYVKLDEYQKAMIRSRMKNT